MTKIFVFSAGDNSMLFPEFGGMLFHVASAITQHGRMLAGAISQDAQTALERCAVMAKTKATDMVSGETTVEIVNPDDERLHAALRECFRRMP